MMTSTQHSKPSNLSFLAEVSLLKHQEQLNFASYRLPPNFDLEVGKKISYRLARYFPNVVVIWHEGVFHALAHLNGEIPSLDE